MTERRRRTPELFSDLDYLIRELRKLHKIVGTKLVVDPEKVRLLKSNSRWAKARRTFKTAGPSRKAA